MKVLVVEDDRSIQMVLELVLTRMGKCEVLVAGEGRLGLSMIKQHKPDVILLDLMLPGMDGFEICQHAKEDPETQRIPIIFLTAQPQPAAIAKAMNLGAAAYMIKPFDPATIITQINEALARVNAPQIR
jgi:two-component system alkaline phosphatase synthesis response regulator PhoP